MVDSEEICLMKERNESNMKPRLWEGQGEIGIVGKEEEIMDFVFLVIIEFSYLDGLRYLGDKQSWSDKHMTGHGQAKGWTAELMTG